MAKPIPLVLDELLSILKEIEATLAWRRLEQKEYPWGITPMGVLSDYSPEYLDTLFGRFMFLYGETRLKLRNPRLSGATNKECDAWRLRLEKMRELFSRLMLVCPASCRL